jgi:replicative DNA helicase/DNA-binding CsgD family transcriptional regulator
MSAGNLPHSAEAEQAVLGSILIDGGAFPRIASMLGKDDFYQPDHRLIYGAMTSLGRDAATPDVVTVADELKRQGHDVQAGGIAYLSTLARETPSSSNVAHYAKIVRDRAVARRALEAADKIASGVISRERDIADLLADAERQFTRLKDQCSAGAASRPSLQSITVHDFLARAIPARKHLLHPVLPEQGLLMIHGPRGLGKTHMTVGIAVAVASGGTFLQWSAPASAGVLLVDGEMPASALQERMARAIQASEQEVRASLHIVTPDLNGDVGMPDLSTTKGQAAVDALVGDAKLIILDNLSSLMRTGIENDAESWQPLQTWALRHRAQGRSVIFIHHSGKAGAQRGTSRREDVLDTVLGLRRPSDYSQTQGARFEVHVEKGRGLYGDDAKAFEAHLTADARGRQIWTMKDLEDGQGEQIASMLAMGMKPNEVAQDLNIHRATVYRHIKATTRANSNA